MVTDLKISGGPGKRGLMFVPYYGRYRAFISNYASWREYNRQGKAVEVAASILSHETIHLTINKFSFTASARLDNLFGGSDNWENYCHGLGNFDAIQRSIAYENTKGKLAKRKTGRSRKK